MTEPLVAVRSLRKYFPITGGLLKRVINHVQAVENVSFEVHEGETLGLVGESGCGKTTVARLLLRMIEPTSGEVLFRGRDLSQLSGRELRSLRREMQLIFQDPYSSLNPRFAVKDIIAEPLVIHRVGSHREISRRVEELLELVGLDVSDGERHPGEFSGGQRQRIGIARALALHPKLVVCDEPVSALDVSIQAQIINLLVGLQRDLDLTYLFIAHNLAVVKHVSDRVGVMYLGQLAELAPTPELFANPTHPYTCALLSAVPEPDPFAKTQRIILKGDIPSPINPPPGCRFHTRCPQVAEVCATKRPEFREIAAGHWVACHHYS
ncbi:MAG: oligopeptide/dipeptide ABC transporter ATP-binding protein [Bacillota bacterium]